MLKFQYVLKTVKKMLKISECSENCNACCVFKISVHVENCNACSKLCWIFQSMLKTCWKFQCMVKTIICVENYVETACWKFQHVLRTVTHVESHVKISRCVENVYIRHVENHIENRVYGTCWNWAADFVFLLWFCMLKWSQTYMSHFSYSCKTEGENGISHLISALCVNCKFTSEHYSGIFQNYWLLNHLDVYLVRTTSETSKNKNSDHSVLI